MAVFMRSFNIAVNREVSGSDATKFRSAWCNFDSAAIAESASYLVKMLPGSTDVVTRLTYVRARSAGAQAIHKVKAEIIEGGTEAVAGTPVACIDPYRVSPRDGDASLPVVEHGGTLTGGLLLWDEEVVGDNPSGKDLDYTEMDADVGITLHPQTPLFLRLTNLVSGNTGGVMRIALGFEQELP